MLKSWKVMVTLMSPYLRTQHKASQHPWNQQRFLQLCRRRREDQEVQVRLLSPVQDLLPLGGAQVLQL